MKRREKGSSKKSLSKSWADIATSNNCEVSVKDEWPDINNRNRNVSENEDIKPLSNQIKLLTNVMDRLTTNDVEQENGGQNLNKSREEITAERKLRRKAKKIEKNEKIFQEKLAQIREPKTQKVKLIDMLAMDRYLQEQEVASIRTGTSRLKKYSIKNVCLMDLINAQPVKPVDRSHIRSNLTAKVTSTTQRHKGKKREFGKKKYLSKLKRSILLSRSLRKQEPNDVVKESSINSTTSHSSDNNESPIKEQNKLDIAESHTVTEDVAPISLNSKFSRNFRPYCDNYTTPELRNLTETLLQDIFRFQDRAYNKNQIKARAQKRYVVGFKESMRQLDVGKVKLLIIAPDLEQSTENGGITETIDAMKEKCRKLNVPYVFSLRRRQLGYVLLKKIPVSCVAVLSYQGAEESSQKLFSLIQEEKIRFQKTTSDLDVS